MPSPVKSRGATAPVPPADPPVVLVVEDRLEVRQLVMRALDAQGVSLQVATSGPDAIEAAMGSLPDLIILDLGLPGCDGLEVIRALRGRGFDRPILILTARGGVADRVEGLDAGADDYVAKPFDVDELCARVRALLRRSRSDLPMLRVGDLECDLRARDIRRGGQSLALTQREFALLEYFMRHPGRPVPREEIARDVWRTEIGAENNIIDVYVSYLRQKLTAGGGAQLLHTVRRVGYVLEDRKGGAPHEARPERETSAARSARPRRRH